MSHRFQINSSEWYVSSVTFSTTLVLIMLSQKRRDCESKAMQYKSNFYISSRYSPRVYSSWSSVVQVRKLPPLFGRFRFLLNGLVDGASGLGSRGVVVVVEPASLSLLALRERFFCRSLYWSWNADIFPLILLLYHCNDWTRLGRWCPRW